MRGGGRKWRGQKTVSELMENEKKPIRNCKWDEGQTMIKNMIFKNENK